MNGLANKLNDDFLSNNKLIFKKFRPIEKIGFGTYGNVYSAIRIKDKCMFAMKTEKITTIKKTLEPEAYYLFLLQGGFGIPQFISYGQSKKYYILIEALLGKNLYQIFIEDKRTCKISDACLIGHQILDRLEWIHSKNLIYRDMKPSNFLIGIKDPNVIYMVDFALCKKYRSTKTGKHILPRKTCYFNGTMKYASSYSLKGNLPTRRDDLIALGYILLFLIKKELPWDEKCKILNQTTFKEFINLKETDGNGKLFHNIPEELIEYVKYTKKLKFSETPDYSYLHSLFNNLLSRKFLNYRLLTFSWIDPKDKELLGIPKSSQKKTSHHKRLLNSIQEEKNNRNTERRFKIKSLLNDNNNKKESYTNIIHLDIKKELNSTQFNNNINNYINNVVLANINYNLKNEPDNNSNILNNSIIWKKKIIKKKNFSNHVKYKTASNLSEHKDENIIRKNNKDNNKNIKNIYQNYKKFIPISVKKKKNAKNENFSIYPNTTKHQNLKYINYNKHKNNSFLSLSNNIEYISPFLQNRNNNNIKNINIASINSNNIIPKEKLYNIIGHRKTTSSGQIYYNNNLNKTNTIKDICKINININNKKKNSRNYEKFESSIVDIIGRQNK